VSTAAHRPIVTVAAEHGAAGDVVAPRVADALGVPLRVVRSPYGHDGFLLETDAVGALLRELLAA
jgi:homoserine acetyltransferase